MSKHTEGLIKISSIRSSLGVNYSFRGKKKNGWVNILKGNENHTSETMVTPEEAKENARRLLVCWNYCYALDTQGMETAVSIGETAKTVLDRHIASELDLKISIQGAQRSARLMTTNEGHEVIAIEPHLWREIIKAKDGAA